MLVLHKALDTFQALSSLLSDPPNNLGKSKDSRRYFCFIAGTTRTRRTDKWSQLVGPEPQALCTPSICSLGEHVARRGLGNLPG